MRRMSAAEVSDPLSDVASASGLCSAGVIQRGLRGAFAVALPPASHALLHCVVRGKAIIAGVQDEPVELRAGQIAVLPHQTPHTIADRWPTSATEEADEPTDTGTIASIGVAEQTVDTLLLTLPFILPSRIEHPVARVRPMLEILDVPHPQVVEMVLLISKLALLPGPGDHYVACRLAEAVLTKVLQGLARAEEDRFGVFAMFASAGVRAALVAVQADPTRAWSIGELAELAKLPRGEFLAQWHDTVGASVTDFIATRRVRLAETLLRTGAATIDNLAERVGFRSEGTLDRAFLRITGHTPEGTRPRLLPRLRGRLERSA